VGQLNKIYKFHCITAYFAWDGVSERRAKLSEIAQTLASYNTVQLLGNIPGLALKLVLVDLIRNFFIF